MDNVGADIKEFVKKEFMTGGRELHDDTNLLEEEIIDSLGIFTLVSFVEDNFGVKVEPEEVNLENFETVEAVAKLVQSKNANAG